MKWLLSFLLFPSIAFADLRPTECDDKDYPYSSYWLRPFQAVESDGLGARSFVSALLGWSQTDLLVCWGFPRIGTEPSTAVVRARIIGTVPDMGLALVLTSSGYRSIYYQGDNPSNPPGIPSDWTDILFDLPGVLDWSRSSIGIVATSGLTESSFIEIDSVRIVY